MGTGMYRFTLPLDPFTFSSRLSRSKAYQSLSWFQSLYARAPGVLNHRVRPVNNRHVCILGCSGVLLYRQFKTAAMVDSCNKT